MVSFGASYKESCEITIGVIEEDIRAAFPDYEVRRAFYVEHTQAAVDSLAKYKSFICICEEVC